MAKKKSTLRALLMSVIALLACVSMLVGSTFAWFTDSVSSMNNIIKSGNLDVELEYSVDGTNWLPVADDVSIFSEDALWEPGYTEVVGLRVKNVGSLALKYTLDISVYLEKTGINVYDEEFKLSDSLKYGAATNLAALTDRASAVALAVNNMNNHVDISGALADECHLLPGESVDSALVITMPTTVGNEANYKTGTAAPYIRFGINLYATQYTHEEDSFDELYDKDADFEKFPVATVTDNGKITVTSEPLFGGGYATGLYGALDLDASYTFVAPQEDSDYDEWYADYEVSVVTPNGANLPEGAIIMSGQYNNNEPEWQSFLTPEVESGVAYRLLYTATNGQYNLSYDLIKSFVGTFNCGVKNVNAPAGTVMTVALKLYNQNAAGEVIAEHTVGLFNYTF